MVSALDLLKKWSRRADVQVSYWGEYDVLRFGKGGQRGSRRSDRVVPYKVPLWVTKKIAVQRSRLAEEARLRGYGR